MDVFIRIPIFKSFSLIYGIFILLVDCCIEVAFQVDYSSMANGNVVAVMLIVLVILEVVVFLVVVMMTAVQW